MWDQSVTSSLRNGDCSNNNTIHELAQTVCAIHIMRELTAECLVAQLRWLTCFRISGAQYYTANFPEHNGEDKNVCQMNPIVTDAFDNTYVAKSNTQPCMGRDNPYGDSSSAGHSMGDSMKDNGDAYGNVKTKMKSDPGPNGTEPQSVTRCPVRSN